LSDVNLRKVEQIAICSEYDAGDILFDENDPCEGIYFVTSGLIGVRKAGLEGESTLIKLAYPNDTLGYRPMLAGECHRATAEALRESAVCFIAKDAVLGMIRDDPALGLSFLQRASRDLGEAEQRYHEKSTLTLRTRFAHLLMLWKDRCGHIDADGKFRLELPVSRTNLAAMLGVRRESVSRMIQKLEKEGVTHFSERHVEVQDPKVLIDAIGESEQETAPRP
jgi:CRP-like cAMP-binding protein